MGPDIELYVAVGTFEVVDARPLLDVLEKYGVRFRVVADSVRIRNLSPKAAAMGGTCGAGARVQLEVRIEDQGKFEQLFRDLYRIRPVDVLTQRHCL